MKKSLLLAAALGAVLALGGLYFVLGQGAPAPVASALTVPSAAPEAVASAVPVPSASAAPPASSHEMDARAARQKLYESVDALIQASKLEQARRLLDEDAERFGNDLDPEWHDLEQSYRLIADCLEHPSAKLRVRAEAFVLVSQAVSLRPRILSACSKTPSR